MGYNCRCKNCGTDFIDMQGEFENDNNEIECPVCDSTDLWFYEEIPNYPESWHPLDWDADFDKLREEYERRIIDTSGVTT